MEQNSKLFNARWWLLALIMILQMIILWQSPEEKTIGVGIKPVYLHVSFTWTGMVLLLGTAILGLIVLFKGTEQIAGWQRTFLLSALWFYGLGFLISMYASWLNWGGIPFQEPRIQGTLNVMVAAIAVWLLREILNSRRIQGILGWIPLAFMLTAREGSRMVLHPDNPVATSPLSIKLTFFLMFGLAILLSVWFIWVQRQSLKSEKMQV
jgi:hypothetical protein